MSAQQHTPGPWAIGGTGGFSNRLEIEPAIGCVYGAGDEILANARLVIAAPDLLDIVKTLAALLDKCVPSEMILDENSPTVDAIRDVLAKVSGGAA